MVRAFVLALNEPQDKLAKTVFAAVLRNKSSML